MPRAGAPPLGGGAVRRGVGVPGPEPLGPGWWGVPRAGGRVGIFLHGSTCRVAGKVDGGDGGGCPCHPPNLARAPRSWLGFRLREFGLWPRDVSAGLVEPGRFAQVVSAERLELFWCVPDLIVSRRLWFQLFLNYFLTI